MNESPTGILKFYAYTGKLDQVQSAYNAALVLAEGVFKLELTKIAEKIPCSCGLAQKDYSKGGIIPRHSKDCATSIVQRFIANPHNEASGPRTAEGN